MNKKEILIALMVAVAAASAFAAGQRVEPQRAESPERSRFPAVDGDSDTLPGFTLVMQSSEPDHREILECIYGSGFLPIGGTTYGNAALGITATRVPDFVDGDPEALGNNLDIGNPSTSATDQVWQDGLVSATARARFASLGQSLGYFLGDAGGTYTNLFDVSGSSCDVTGQAEVAFNPGETWRWARQGSGRTWTSRTSDNDHGGPGVGEDHMVTYQVSGANGGGTTFLLFWEDLSGLGDQDYNDFVVELVIPDADGDGIGDDEDVCPDTIIPESVPTHHLGVNRWALVDDDNIFDTTPPPGGGNGPGYEFTLEDTAGCSCEQIIEELNLGLGHVKFGCSNGAMLQWMRTVSDSNGRNPTSIFERNWRLPPNGIVHMEPGR